MKLKCKLNNWVIELNWIKLSLNQIKILLKISEIKTSIHRLIGTLKTNWKGKLFKLSKS